MKSLIVFTACLFALSAAAQTRQVSLPTGPFIAPHAPEMSSWTAVYTWSGKPEAEEEAAHQTMLEQQKQSDPELVRILEKNPGFAQRVPRIVRLETVKTGPIKVEVTVYSSGVKGERWLKRQMIALRDPFVNRIVLEPSTAAGPEHDFPDFAWVAEKYFKGIELVGGRECLLFEGTVLDSQVESGRLFMEDSTIPGEEITATAVIDLETRLPVLLKYKQVVRTYSFNAPPGQQLTLPTDVAEQIAKSERLYKSLNARLAPP